MISLAGVPFTAGFLGKFFIFDAAVRQHQTGLIIIGVITVGCGFYYYLKVVRAMSWLEPPPEATLQTSVLSRLTITAPNGGDHRLRRLPATNPERASPISARFLSDNGEPNV